MSPGFSSQWNSSQPAWNAYSFPRASLHYQSHASYTYCTGHPATLRVKEVRGNTAAFWTAYAAPRRGSLGSTHWLEGGEVNERTGQAPNTMSLWEGDSSN
ncbi:hypothetical protein H920_11317 [Fukomys damarensis]|uniref:Uncharacterized protein n=1 Tax=Fukomys damarensis TaxID=885580 RepID=A0A091D5B2_FUKDA|nr:hypothetical protein H920_11317 [Fukomys damarensis]